MLSNRALEAYINEYLNVTRIKDIASNGLQVEGAQEINKIALGVSLSLDFLHKAVEFGANTVLVHHGIFWGYPLLIKNYVRKRIQFILDNNINLLAYHLPLDLNRELGNNISIAKLLSDELYNIENFGYYKGTAIGFKIEIPTTKLSVLVNKLETKLGRALSIIDPKKEKDVNTIAIVSGGAPELFDEAIEKGIDLFITGELAEYSQAMAIESGVKYIALGHYNSEKLGVQNLGKIIEKQFAIETKFFDIPNRA